MQMSHVVFVIVFVIVATVYEIPISYAQIDYPELGIRVETVADNLRIPWSIDWLSDGTAIFTERGGTISIIKDHNDTLPILSLDVEGGEGGLLGIAVDPNFEQNQYVYVYYTYRDLFSLYNKIERYQYLDDTVALLHDAHTILDKIPASSYHDGGRIQFGPADGMLYIATGDAGDPNLSQNVDSLAGKILRINSDGSIPDDNPWENSPVYSLGHRNPQGMDWNDNNVMIITEHGPSGWIGANHDEINVISPGKNYGWPHVIGSNSASDNTNKLMYENPVFHTGSITWAPSGSEFYESDNIPEWQDRYFVASLFGQSLWMLEFDSDDNSLKVTSSTPLFSGEFGRLRDVQTGPDGYLYVLTSNQDGRGTPELGDDKILRIVPLYENAMQGPDDDIKQQLWTFLYDDHQNTETANTEPLYAALRHPGYNVVSPISLDIQQKSLEFEFALENIAVEQSHAAVDLSSLSLYVEKPLLSPPFEIIIYDESNNIISHKNNTSITTKYGLDNYIIIFNTDLERGHVVVIGTHVIPEYEDAIIIIIISTIIASSGILVSKRAAIFVPVTNDK